MIWCSQIVVPLLILMASAGPPQAASQILTFNSVNDVLKWIQFVYGTLSNDPNLTNQQKDVILKTVDVTYTNVVNLGKSGGPIDNVVSAAVAGFVSSLAEIAATQLPGNLYVVINSLFNAFQTATVQLTGARDPDFEKTLLDLFNVFIVDNGSGTGVGYAAGGGGAVGGYAVDGGAGGAGFGNAVGGGGGGAGFGYATGGSGGGTGFENAVGGGGSGAGFGYAVGGSGGGAGVGYATGGVGNGAAFGNAAGGGGNGAAFGNAAGGGGNGAAFGNAVGGGGGDAGFAYAAGGGGGGAGVGNAVGGDGGASNFGYAAAGGGAGVGNAIFGGGIDVGNAAVLAGQYADVGYATMKGVGISAAGAIRDWWSRTSALSKVQLAKVKIATGWGWGLILLVGVGVLIGVVVISVSCFFIVRRLRATYYSRKVVNEPVNAPTDVQVVDVPCDCPEEEDKLNVVD